MKSALPLAMFAALLTCASSLTADDKTAQEELFEALDQNGDGTLAPGEIDEPQRKAFERLLRSGDANDDGSLTRDEYLKGLKPDAPAQIDQPQSQRPGQRGPDRGGRGFDVGRLFEMADRDGDGKIALDQLPEPLQERLQPLFERLGKEELTRENFEQMRPQTGRPAMQSDRPQMALVRLLDADGNGQLSKEELAQLADRFDTLDANKDGQLGPGELIGFGDREMSGEGNRRPGRPDAAGNPQGRRPQRPDGSSPKPGEGQTQQARGMEGFVKQNDKNSDGVLSKDEVPERMAERFDRLDADNDGKLTPQELGRMFQRGNRETK